MFSYLINTSAQSKCLILLLIFVIVSGSVSAQGRYGIALEKNAIFNSSSISGDLYSGIDNYLKVDESIKSEYQNLYLLCTNGTVVRDTSDGFLAIPEKPGKVRFTLYSSNGNDTITIGYKFFTVKRVPDPRLKIDNVLIPIQGQVRKAFLISSTRFTVHVSDDIPGSENWIEVKDVTLGYNYGGFHVSYLNASDKMLSGTRDILSTLGPDREISIKATAEYEGGVLSILPIYRLMIY